jgi:hypothetical protein
MANVTHYQLEWLPKGNRGRIKIKSDAGEAVEVPVDSVEEFIAVALILSKAPVEVNDGVLKAGPVAVGT